jgi:predicted DNA repair protein MutK
MPWLLDECDDLALNAQQVTGVKADRDLTVVWAVAKGSL